MRPIKPFMKTHFHVCPRSCRVWWERGIPCNLCSCLYYSGKNFNLWNLLWLPLKYCTINLMMCAIIDLQSSLEIKGSKSKCFITSRKKHQFVDPFKIKLLTCMFIYGCFSCISKYLLIVYQLWDWDPKTIVQEVLP